MAVDQRQTLLGIKRFDQLIAYLRDELGWPISRDSFDDVDDLFYEFSAEELGIDPKTAAKIQEIKRLRPLSTKQPWGIFFIKFEPKKLPVVALRRILGQVAQKKRTSANSAERTAWSADDLLFISNYGDGDERQISFAHFSQSASKLDLPTLRVLGWNNLDTALHIDAIAAELTQNLRWPEDDQNLDQWRKSWSNAFKLGHNEVINTAKELSIHLAGLASNIRDRIKSALTIESESGPLTKLMRSLQASLVSNLDVNSFADMYAQTIAYGLLSARITDPTKKTVDDFTSHMRTSPFLRELMQSFLKIGGRKGNAGGPGIDFDELGVGDIVQLLDNANMEAVVRDFGDRNRQEDPVLHFFEGFLQAYDSKIRKDRGVFYTPQPVVSYIVRSVHTTLQCEFGLADGLADTTTWREMLIKHPNLELPLLTNEPGEKKTISPDEFFVQILDPATGTATFIIEIIDIIYATLKAKWKLQKLSNIEQNEAWNTYVPLNLLPRIYAYELMMAPYAIAHMKISLKLAETGYNFKSNERARIYLTNALEPWQKQLNIPDFEALAHEAKAVNEIKRLKHFTVVIGNPPYSGESKNKNKFIMNLLEDYKREPEGGPLQEKNSKWINDDYVKFMRLGQELISKTKLGIIGLITNHSWLDNPTFRGMRASLMRDFQNIYVLDMRGNAKKKDKTPERYSSHGDDKNVFDIEQGVSITLLVRTYRKDVDDFELSIQEVNPIKFENLGWLADSCVKHADLWGSRVHKYQYLGKNEIHSGHFEILSPKFQYLLFVPRDNDLAHIYEQWWKANQIFPINSVGIVTARDSLTINFTLEELKKNIEAFSELSIERAREIFNLGGDVRDWSVEWAKKDLQDTKLHNSYYRSISYRPFDNRFTYYTGKTKGFHCMPRNEVMNPLIKKDDNIFLGICRQVKSGDWAHALVGSGLVESCFISNRTSEIASIIPMWYSNHDQFLLNFDGKFLKMLAEKLGVHQDLENNDLPEGVSAIDIWAYIYSILFAPSYREKFGQLLKGDFPRIPLCGADDFFNKSLWDELIMIGRKLIDLHTKSKDDSIEKSDFPVAGNNLVEKPFFQLSQNIEIGRVWINSEQYFESVPQESWHYKIGAYQVCEKWLKDRKGRALTDNDIKHYQAMVKTISETIQIMSQIDLIIDKHGGWENAFSTEN